MPEICRFRGIVVSVNFDDHPPPHIHVRRGEENGRVRLEPLGDMDGTLAAGTRRLVLLWASAHVPELLADWYLARAYLAPIPVPPPEE